MNDLPPVSEWNRIIAERCGWTRLGQAERSDEIGGVDPKSGYRAPIPNYTGSLDAMHEAEKTMNDTQLVEYMIHLERICFVERNEITWELYQMGVGDGHDESIFATALQRAEAFIRATNF